MKYLYLSLILVLTSCNNNKIEAKVDNIHYSFTFENISSIEGIDSVHFRGLSLTSSNNVWITGTKSTYLFHDGLSWFKGNIDSTKNLDFRDVEAFENCTAIAISAGSPGKIYKTVNCGNTWSEVYSNSDSLIFYDGLDFWDTENGFAFGDQIDGKVKMIQTQNKGETWMDIDTSLIPNALKNEAGFAASGTGIQLFNDSIIYIGLGGNKARFMISYNKGHNWTLTETPMLNGDSGKGIYSIAFKDELNGVAVGGSWENIKCDSSKIYTNDGGLTWTIAKGIQHYRSCVTHVEGDIYISTGTTGTDISYDNGKNWQFLDSTNLNAIQFDSINNVGIGVGSYGKIVKITYTK